MIRPAPAALSGCADKGASGRVLRGGEVGRHHLHRIVHQVILPGAQLCARLDETPDDADMLGQAKARAANQHVVIEHEAQVFEGGFVGELGRVATRDPLPLPERRGNQTEGVEDVEGDRALRPSASRLQTWAQVSDIKDD